MVATSAGLSVDEIRPWIMGGEVGLSGEDLRRVRIPCKQGVPGDARPTGVYG